MFNHGTRRMRAERSPLSAAEDRAATTRAVQAIVRRLGVVLGAALDAAIGEMIRKGMVDTPSVLRDELKPLVDALVHFEVSDAEVDHETP